MTGTQVEQPTSADSHTETRPKWFNQVYKKIEKGKDNWFKKLADRRVQQPLARSSRVTRSHKKAG